MGCLKNIYFRFLKTYFIGKINNCLVLLFWNEGILFLIFLPVLNAHKNLKDSIIAANFETFLHSQDSFSLDFGTKNSAFSFLST